MSQELYPNSNDLNTISVFSEDGEKHFKISGLPQVLCYGKHYFSLSWIGDDLKDSSPINFEFRDSENNLIFSDITDYEVINGTVICYVWIKKDPLRIYDEISDGEGTLTIVGELENVGTEWKGVPNVRYTIPIEIKKDLPNTSPVLFQNINNIQTGTSFTESKKFDVASTTYNRSYIAVSSSNLSTFGGKVTNIELSYKEERSKSDEFKVISIYPLTGSIAFSPYEVPITSIDGLNPLSDIQETITPRELRRNGNVDFRIRFLNNNGEFAQDIINNKDVEITGSIANFTGSTFNIETNDNLIKNPGSFVFGSTLDNGFRVDFKDKTQGNYKGETTLEFTPVVGGVDQKGYVIAEKGGFVNDPGSNEVTQSENSSLVGSTFSIISSSNQSIILGASGSSILYSPQSGIYGGIFNEIHHSSSNQLVVGSQIYGGTSNIISGSVPGYTAVTDNSVIIGGTGNQIHQTSSIGLTTGVIIGGIQNKINKGLQSTVIGGYLNKVNGNYSAVVGGTANRVDNNNSVILAMTSKTSSADDTVYVQNLSVDGSINASSLDVTHFTSSFITASTIQTSGSNIFGDEITDTHLFRGHITASGNISASGYILADGIISSSQNIIGAGFFSSATGHELRTGTIGLGRSNAGGSINPGGIFHYANTDSKIQFYAGHDSINVVTTNFNVDTNITASGNISASGDVITRRVTTNGENQTLELSSRGNSMAPAIFINENPNPNPDVYQINATGFGAQQLRFDGHSNPGILFITSSGNVGISPQGFTGNDSSDGIPKQALHVKGNLLITSSGHITASGNISSSGEFIGNSANVTNITGSTLFIDNQVDATKGVLFRGDDFNFGIGDGDDTIADAAYFQVLGEENYLRSKLTNNFFNGNITSSGYISTTSHITASGDISASGDIKSNKFILANAGTEQDFIHSPAENEIELRVNNIINTEFKHNTTKFSVPIETTSHITASGNISASGTIFASAFSSPDGDGDIDFSDSLDVAGNITASGNISASGNLTGNKLYLKSATSTNIFMNGEQTITKEANGDLNIGMLDDGVGTRMSFYLGQPFAGDALTISGSNGNVGVGIFDNIPQKLTVAGNISASGAINTLSHITASGKISASGALHTFGNLKIRSANVTDAEVVNGDTFLQLSAAGLNIEVGGSETQFHTATSHHFMHPITASGNISASGTTHTFGGDITATSGSFSRLEGVNTIQDAGGELHIISDDTKFIGDGFTIQNAAASEKFKIDTSTSPAEVSGDFQFIEGVKFSSHITASGNISSSGTGSFEKVTIGTTSSAPDMELTVQGNISASSTVYFSEIENINTLRNSSGEFSINNSDTTIARDDRFTFLKFSNQNAGIETAGIILKATQDHSGDTAGGSKFQFVAYANDEDITADVYEAVTLEFDPNGRLHADSSSLHVIGSISASGNMSNITVPKVTINDTTIGSTAPGVTLFQSINNTGAGLIISGGQSGGNPAGFIDTVGHTSLNIREGGDNYIRLFGDKIHLDKNTIFSAPITASAIISASSGVETDHVFTPTGDSMNVTAFTSLNLTATNGAITLDSAQDMELNADGGDINFKDNTVTLGGVNNSGIFSSNHITASGNISSSGTINTSQYLINGQNVASLAGDPIMSIASTNKQTQINGLAIKLDAPVTASETIFATGNIESDGTIIGDGLNINGTTTFNDGNITNVGTIDVDTIRADADSQVIYNLNAGGHRWAGNTGDMFSFDGSADVGFEFDNINGTVFYMDGGDNDGRVGIGNPNGTTFNSNAIPPERLTVEGNISQSGNFITQGHITASGDISASGTGLFGALKVNGTDYLGNPTTLSELNESTDATDDKIILWDQDASAWKYMTLDNLQDSIDTTGGGGGVSFPTTEVISSSAHIHTLSNITASGNISASGGGHVFGGSGDAQLDVQGHITASGNISSSGRLQAAFLDVVGGDSSTRQTAVQYHTGTTNLTFGDVDLPTRVQGTTITLGTAATQHITASGNISGSASSHLSIGQNITLDLNSKIMRGADEERVEFASGITNFNSSGDNTDFKVTAESAQPPLIHGDAANVRVGIRKENPTTTLEVGGDISGSGDLYVGGSMKDVINITASGTYLGKRQFNLSPSSANKIGQGDIIYQGGGSTTLGDIVYMKTDGEWGSAQANAEATSTSLLGIALGSDPDVNGVLLRGTYTLDHDVGDNQGIPLYLSEDNAGQAKTAAPTDAGEIVRIIGYNLGDDNEIWFDPDKTWVKRS